MAGTENLRWMAGTFVGSSPNQKYCFGTGGTATGWHDPDLTGTAADIFADSAGQCNDPDGASNTVWASNRGKTTVWPTYILKGWAYDGGSINTYREDVYVQVLWWNGSSWQAIGYEWYKHTTSTLGSGKWYDIQIGSNFWANSYLALGNTKYPENAGCTSTAFHLHQIIYTPATTITWTRNTTGLAINTIYSQEDINKYIHNWTGW